MSRRHSFATVIVGKSSLLRDGVAKILHSANFRVVASVSCADDLPAKVQADRPLFLIVHTGNDIDFVAGQVEHFRDGNPNGRIAVVADRYRPDELVSAFRAGANGCFVNDMTCDVFIRSLELVMMGETVVPPAFLSYVSARVECRVGDGPGAHDNGAIIVTETDDMTPLLSPRETLILHCLIEGDSNKSIARKMDIAEATVKVHVKAILRKIRVHNRTQAAIWGMNNGYQPQTTGAIAPPLSPDTAKRLATATGPSPHIEQNDGPICSGAVDQANHAEMHRLDDLLRKDASLRTEATIRSRKYKAVQ